MGAKVNSDEFLPPACISNAICEAMLGPQLGDDPTGCVRRGIL